MPYLTVGRENSGDIEIYYEDHGSGTPVVLTHGYPLNGSAWEKQVPMLLAAGYRVILHDRRGWGRSSQPATGHDYDTFAADYRTLIEHLDLQDAVLVGHSMGTGEVTRYLGTYGSARVRKAVLISAIPPFFLQTDDNPVGPPPSLFDGFVTAATNDRLAWFKGFLENFYNMDAYGGSLVSEEAFQNSFQHRRLRLPDRRCRLRPRPGTPTSAPTSPASTSPILVVPRRRRPGAAARADRRAGCPTWWKA